jgi:TusA-related sulfurtransferase
MVGSSACRTAQMDSRAFWMKPGRPAGRRLVERWFGRPLESRPTQEREMQADKEIDTRGLSCPLPILKAKKALADLQSGQLLKVLATDPGSIRDFQAFSKQTGNELVEQQTLDGGEYVHLMRRR